MRLDENIKFGAWKRKKKCEEKSSLTMRSEQSLSSIISFLIHIKCQREEKKRHRLSVVLNLSDYRIT